MTEVRSDWEGQVVNGEFQLQRYLAGSYQSAVYLTEFTGQPQQQAAIKLVPADAVNPELLLSQWKMAEGLSHPHLIRFFQTGRCHLDAGEFLFLVMEYAEESLAQIVPERPLSPEEVRQMLNPALDALSYLHGQGLVHGGMKPANIMAVNDQLKLSIDNLGKAGEPALDYGQPSIYVPPEKGRGAASPAEDIWSLGMTLAEVLTQHVPFWSEQEQADPELPDLPAPFSEIVRGCLRRDAAQRWTIADIRSRLHPVPVAPEAAQRPQPAPPGSPVSQSVPKPHPAQPAPMARISRAAPPASRKARPVVPGIIATVAVIALALIVSWWGLSHRQPASQSTGVAGEQQSESQTPAAPSNKTSGKPAPTRSQSRNRASAGAPADGEVVQQQLPEVSPGARGTIHGTVRVNVKVQVDRSGNVVGSAFDSAGPSRYFARLAMGAAQNWKFTPSGQNVTREFVLHFEFTSTGTRAFATSAKG